MQLQIVSFSFSNVSIDFNQMLKDLLDKIDSKLSTYKLILKITKEFIENLYLTHLNYQATPFFKSCSLQSSKNLKYDKYFGLKVDRSSSCEIIFSQLYKYGAFTPKNNLI